MRFTFSGRYLANIIGFATRQGAERQPLLDLTGYGLEELCEAHLRLSPDIYNQVVEEAVASSGDAALGLHVGEYLNLSAIGLVGQIAQSSKDIREALEHICHFANLGCQALPMSLDVDKKDCRLLLQPSPLWVEQSPVAVQHTIDAVFVFTVREFHTLTRQLHYPKAVHFHFSKPDYWKEYDRIFRCPVKFAQPETALVLDASILTEPVVTSDYGLLQVLLQHAENKLEQLRSGQGFSTMVKQSIVQMVAPQFPTLDQVAQNMNLSTRTLQRKLKSEGQTYKDIVDELKQQFAYTYLQKPDLQITEIAYLLDYADASTFIRSFKRWEGKTPQVYREMNKINQPVLKQTG